MFAVAVTVGCAALSGITDLEVVDCVRDDCDSGADAALDAASADSADGAADARDAGKDAVMDAITDAADGADTAPIVCPDATPEAAIGDAGACTGVVVPTGSGSYCVDATEVSNARYAAFLASANVCAQPSFCAWNTSFVPAAAWPAPVEKADHPVVHVDWCDAYAYCASVGKRLCGRIGGGANAADAFDDPAKSQWFRACSNAGTRTYPYGNAYSTSACNGGDLDLKTTVVVGSKAACVGGYPGLFDMSGNVWEWEDSCSAVTGAADPCRLRGGAFNNTSAGLACAVDFLGIQTLRSKTYNNVGFRCCGP